MRRRRGGEGEDGALALSVVKPKPANFLLLPSKPHIN
jgi:hypothetical protein